MAVTALLLDHGANLKAADKDGNTVLHYTVKDKAPTYFPETEAQDFIHRGVDPNAKNAQGQTPLGLARALHNNQAVTFFQQVK